MATFSWASSVEAPRWGVRISRSFTLRSGESAARGSLENTSRAAPAITPCSTASARAASSTMPPRAQFTSRAVGFMVRRSAAFTRFSVSGVRGRCRVT